jgi:glycerophosphoryl diester phosphodiesterase
VWRALVRGLVVVLTMLELVGCGTEAVPQTALQRWLATTPMYIAHRGGDADWTEGTADAYAHAAAWNPGLALEVPVRLTSDGVWVVSEDSTTGRVFGTDDDIARTPWAVLSRLRTLDGHRPMARLVSDVLAVYPRDRIVFVDDKPDADVPGLLRVLQSYGGPTRFVVKSFYQTVDLPRQARRLGYLTWGYYYAANMGSFAATQGRFDLLGLDYGAPAADFAIMRRTGKPVIAHIVGNAKAAAAALGKGAAGLMVSAVRQVVPHPPN